jgi:hypothetical protein
MIKKFKILSRHSKLSEAVAAADIDLSYNEELALNELAQDDKDQNIKAAYVLEMNGEKSVHYEYHCDIKLFNKYEPFHSCLDNSLFRKVEITDSEIYIGEPALKRTQLARRTISKWDWIVTTL